MEATIKKEEQKRDSLDCAERQVREDGGASCREQQGQLCADPFSFPWRGSDQEGGAPRLQMSRS